jgi:hypothetical protein
VAEPWRPDAQLVARVDGAMTLWRQGDVARPGPVGWLADRSSPLTQQTNELGGEGLGFSQIAVDAVVVVTQTCDIVKTCWSEDGDAWPFVQVCPVIVLEGRALTEAAGGHSSRFAPLPALGADHFADLLLCSTHEKTVLLGLEEHTPGCDSDEDRERFAAAVDRNRRRFAFPDGMDQVLNPLRSRFRDKWKRDSAEGRRIAEVWEIRARHAQQTPWYGEDQVEVELTFVVAPDALPMFSEEDADRSITAEVEAWAQSHDGVAELAEKLESTGDPVDQSYLWQRLVLAWIAKCGTDDRVLIKGATAESAASYSLARARLEPRLDLDHLSGF